MLDQSGQRAEVGLQPIQNVFTSTGADGQVFEMNIKAKARDLSNSVGGYVQKNLQREVMGHEPKELFLTTV